MGSPFWTQYSPPCVLLRLAVNHRIDHLRLLPPAPANPFCPGLHWHFSYCQPRVKWTLCGVLGGWEIGFIHNKADLGSKLSLCCDLLCWHTWKKEINWDSANHCFPLLVTLTTSNTCSHGERKRESLWLTDVGQNQNATQILTSALHQGKRCSPKPGVAFIS